MTKWLSHVVVVCLVSCCSLAQTDKKPQPPATKHHPALSAQEIFRLVSHSVFVVEALDDKGDVAALGSGLYILQIDSVADLDRFLSDVNQLVTNKHVVEGARDVRIRQGTKTWPAKVVAVDKHRDVCVLEVKGKIWRDTNRIDIRPSSTLAVGEKVYAIGAPEGLELSMSEGIISGLRKDESGALLVQTTAPISHGSSGGGLFDAQGRLIGITTFTVREGQNLNFAIPAQDVMSSLNTAREGSTTDTAHPESEEPKAAPASNEQNDALQAALSKYRKSIVERCTDLVHSRCLGAIIPVPAELGMNFEAALNVFELAAETFPENPVAQRAAADMAQVVLDEDQRDQEKYPTTGLVALSLKHYYAALQLNPSDYITHFNLALLLRSGVEITGNRDDEVIANLREAVRLRPDFVEAHDMLGAIFKQRGENDAAIAELMQAQRLRAAHCEPVFDNLRYEDLALLMEKKGDLKTAEVELSQATACDPLDKTAHFSLADILEKDGAPEKATGLIQGLAQRLPDDPEVRNRLARSLYAKGDLRGAMAAYRQALQQRPDFADAHYGLGNVLAGEGDFNAAIEEYNKACGSDSPCKDVRVLNARGVAYSSKHDWYSARSNLLEATRLEPDNPEFHYNLGIALENQGNEWGKAYTSGRERLDDAQVQYRMASRLDPGNEKYRSAYERLSSVLQQQKHR